MGLRAGDIAKLKLSEINFSSGYISIIQEKTGIPLTLQMPCEVVNAISMHFDNQCKYDLTQHPNYKLTADYDKRNYFDVVKFLSHNLILKADDEYEVINVPNEE